MTNISEKTTGSCKDREYIVTEVCPHCEAEVEMRWNVAADGYKAFCPHCGNRLMLNDLADALENGNADTDDEETEACGLEGTYEWLLNNFDIDGTAGRIIHNVLEYADRMTGDEQYEFLTEMLDGTIGLSDREIRNLCWN